MSAPVQCLLCERQLGLDQVEYMPCPCPKRGCEPEAYCLDCADERQPTPVGVDVRLGQLLDWGYY